VGCVFVYSKPIYLFNVNHFVNPYLLFKMNDNISNSNSSSASNTLTTQMASADASTSTTEFSDNTATVAVGQPTSSVTPFKYLLSPPDSYEQFFSRPVLMYTASWTGTPFTTINVAYWNYWSNIKTVRDKLNNFARFRGTFHLRFVVNSSPMQYGALLAAWAPGQQVTAGSGIPGVPLSSSTCRLSQLRHVILSGSGSSSAEMVIPMFSIHPFLDILDTATFIDQGTLQMKELCPLSSSTDASVVSASVQIFAWCTDVSLAVPTVYSTSSEWKPGGPISAPLQNIALGFTALGKSVPRIEAFTTVAAIAAKLGSGMAAAFGYSMKPDLREPPKMYPVYVPTLANVSGLSSAQKLTIDPKQEIGMGNGWSGAPGEDDPLAIKTIANRPAIISNIAWSTNDSVGTQLVHRIVAPRYSNVVSAGDFDTTPLLIAALPFRFWSGSIVYRVRVFCSPTMTGRLLVYHYPHNDNAWVALNTQQVVGVLPSCILDVGATTDEEFIVAQSQLSPWIENQVPADGTVTTAPTYCNGVFICQVLTELCAPQTASVRIVVSVRGGADFCVNEPDSNIMKGITFLSTSSEWTQRVPVSGPIAQRSCELNSRLVDKIPYEPYFGEENVSMRPLIKRRGVVYCIQPIANATAVAKGNLVSQQARFNFYPLMHLGVTIDRCIENSVFALMCVCFAGVRGGVRVGVQPFLKNDEATTVPTILNQSINRVATNNSSGWPTASDFISNFTTLSLTTEYPLMGSLVRYDFNGVARTNVQNPFIEAEVPYQSPKLFCNAYDRSDALFCPPDDIQYTCSFLAPNASATMIFYQVYMSAADDVSFHEWVGFGTIRYTAPAAFDLTNPITFVSIM
jgi:hypothetical protein